MKLTKEQIAIIKSSGDTKINALAGSGKTTTILEYTKARPKNSIRIPEKLVPKGFSNFTFI